MTPQRHQNSVHFQYEIVLKPFYGSTARARAALGRFTGEALSEAAFLDALRRGHPELYDGLQWVKFYRWNSGGMEWRIAVVNTAADWALRRTFFDARQGITDNTGWYPLVQGAWAHFGSLALPAHPPRRSVGAVLDIGDLRQVTVLAAGDDGSSFALEGANGSIVADLGIGHGLGFPAHLRAAVLSHFHADHSGGLGGFIEQSRAPVVMSDQTLTHLFHLAGTGYSQQQLLSRSWIVAGEDRFPLRSGGSIEFFPTLHCPGSLGFRYQDAHARTFLYTGDLCLRNSFADYRDQFRRMIDAVPAQRSVVLMDATMVDRRGQDIPADDTPESLLDDCVVSIQKRDAFFVSQQPETMVYTYLIAFSKFIKAGVRPALVIEPDLLQHLRVYWKEQFIARRRTLDPALAHLGGDTFHNFAESQQLYPIEEAGVMTIPATEHCVFFARLDRLRQSEELLRRMKNADVFLLGTLALREDVPTVVDRARPRLVLRVAGPNWSFHSNEEDLLAACELCAAKGIRVLLFHSFEARVKRFLRRCGVRSEYTQPFSSGSVEL